MFPLAFHFFEALASRRVVRVLVQNLLEVLFGSVVIPDASVSFRRFLGELDLLDLLNVFGSDGRRLDFWFIQVFEKLFGFLAGFGARILFGDTRDETARFVIPSFFRPFPG